VLNDQLRLVARIWMRIRTEGGSISEEQGCLSSSWEDLQDQTVLLMDKKEDLLISQYHLLGAVMRKVDMPDFKTFVSIYGKMLINSFALRMDTRKISVASFAGSKYGESSKRIFSPEPIGIGLYLLGSLLGHSCVPNCSVKFLGRDLFIVAKEAISGISLATISYINTMSDTRTRRSELMDNWSITCTCSLCLDTK